MFACFTRTDKLSAEADPCQDAWLTEQLKFTRDQLDKKSSLCDQLAAELRQAQEQLEANEKAQLPFVERVPAPEEAPELSTDGEEGKSPPLSPRRRRELQLEVETLKDELLQERESHRETTMLLEASKERHARKFTDLQQELKNVSAGLEQKEEDILSISFSMVELQNRLRDQGRLVMENADAFQIASEELADKDEALEKAVARQQELLKEMNSVSSELEAKVAKLTQELDGSKASYQALQEQTCSVIRSLEAHRDKLIEELQKTKLEAATEISLLKQQLQVFQLGSRQASEDQTSSAQAKISDLSAKLELSRTLERQAADKLKEYKDSVQNIASRRPSLAEMPVSLRSPRVSTGSRRLSLGEDGLASPRSPLEREVSGSSVPADEDSTPERKDGPAVVPAVASVLIAVEIDLGPGIGRATLTVAPWQTRSDFDTIVTEFLSHHRVKPVFTQAVVHYLEDIEKQATTFPAMVQASLDEIYSHYG